MRERQSRIAQRTWAMASKEILHIQRDPRMLYFAIVMPAVMLLLFGFGISFDTDRVPIAVCDADHTPESRALANAFGRSKDFDIVARPRPEEIEGLFQQGRAQAALVMRPGYGRNLANERPAEVELVVDGADPSSANQIMQKADAIARAETRGRILRLGVPTQPTVEARAWIRYNPRALSPIFLVPGLTAYLLGVGAVLLTALSIAREWEHGSMEQLFASPVGRFEIILGKLVPYLGIGMLQLLVILVVGTTVFDVPVRGSLLLLLGLALLFLVCMLGQGLLISATSRNQFLATQRGLITSLLPSLLLSGMLFPIDNMPMALKVISWAVPARYLVHAFRGIMLKGGGWETAWPDFVALSIFAVVVLTFATVRFQRRIA